jgi:hypothetical protein
MISIATYSVTFSTLSFPVYEKRNFTPYKATNKVTVSCILLAVFFVPKRIDQQFWRELFQLLPEFNVVTHSSLLKLDTAVREDLMISSIKSIHVH